MMGICVICSKERRGENTTVFLFLERSGSPHETLSPAPCQLHFKDPGMERFGYNRVLNTPQCGGEKLQRDDATS